MATNGNSSSSGNDSSELKCVKILVLGDAGIGKTCFRWAYFSMLDIDTLVLDIQHLDIFSMYSSRNTFEGKEVYVGLIEMNCWADSPERRETYPTDVNVILLTYSIGHYSTLKSVYNLWIHEVRSHFGKLVPVFLVGLRSDMRLVNPAILVCSVHEDTHVVQKNEAEIIHKKYHFYGDYMECCRYDGDSVIQIIQRAVMTAMED